MAVQHGIMYHNSLLHYHVANMHSLDSKWLRTRN